MIRIEPQHPVDFCGLAIIGEAAGATEIEKGLPFVGKAGQFLDTVLSEVGIEKRRCLVTNVFLERPENNKIDRFFRAVQDEDGEFIQRYGLYRGRVVKEANRYDLERLQRELETYQPTIFLLLGATSLWRIARTNGITEARGKWTLTILPGISHMVGIMPTYHPSAVMRGKMDASNEKLTQFISDIRLVKEVLDGL